MRSFLPPRNGWHRRRRRRCRHRRGVRQRRCGRHLWGGEASYWTAVTLPLAKWQKYKGLGLNVQ